MISNRLFKTATFVSALLLAGCVIVPPQVPLVPSEEAAAIRYVGANALNVRVCPNINCEVAAKFHRGQIVEVFEARDGWSRISEYYETKTTGSEYPQNQDVTRQVARWAASDFLWKHKPDQALKAEAKETVLAIPAEPRTEVKPEVTHQEVTPSEPVVSEVTPPEPAAPEPDVPELLFPEAVSVDHLIRGLPEAGVNNFTKEDIDYLRAYADAVVRSGECSSVEYADKSVIVDGRYYVHCAGEELHRFFFPEEAEEPASPE